MLKFIIYTRVLDFKISTKPRWRNGIVLVPQFNQSFHLPEIYGSSPTRPVQTIFLFIMHGCLSIH